MNIRCLADIDFAASPIYSAILMLKACMHKTRMLGRGGWERSEYRLGTGFLRFALLRFASQNPGAFGCACPKVNNGAEKPHMASVMAICGLAGPQRREC